MKIFLNINISPLVRAIKSKVHELSPKLTNSSLETKIIEVIEEEDDIESINLDVDPQTASLEVGVNGLASVVEGEDVIKQAAAD